MKSKAGLLLRICVEHCKFAKTSESQASFSNELYKHCIPLLILINHMDIYLCSGYLAPEFVNGVITYRFDLYSLGVIIIEILTGKKGYHDVDDVRTVWGLFQKRARLQN